MISVKKINRLKFIKILKNHLRAPSSVKNVKLIWIIDWPRPFTTKIATKSGKSPKWRENDQFRQINFLIKRFFGSSYTPFDAELHKGFFEITSRFLSCSVIELTTKKPDR